jgi:hypothetical protein
VALGTDAAARFADLFERHEDELADGWAEEAAGTLVRVREELIADQVDAGRRAALRAAPGR